MRYVKKVLVLLIFVLVSMAFVAPITAATEEKGVYKDTKGHWADAYIWRLSLYNFVHGDETGMFYPDKAVTRAEFVKMLCEVIRPALDWEVDMEDAPYQDLDADAWYYKYVCVAAANGLLPCYKGDYFSPGSAVIRDDMAKMIGVALAAVDDPINYEKPIYKSFDEFQRISFVDAEEIDDVILYIFLLRQGILSGFELEEEGVSEDGKSLKLYALYPKQELTKAQATIMLFRLMRYVDYEPGTLPTEISIRLSEKMPYDLKIDGETLGIYAFANRRCKIKCGGYETEAVTNGDGRYTFALFKVYEIGNNEIEFEVSDWSGYTETWVLNVWVDPIMPVVYLTGPEKDMEVVEPFRRITITGITEYCREVELYVDGELIHKKDNGQQSMYCSIWDGYPEGKYLIELVGRNESGEVRDTRTLVVSSGAEAGSES